MQEPCHLSNTVFSHPPIQGSCNKIPRNEAARLGLNVCGLFAGETFVLDDGGETDLDLGNYERFLNISVRYACMECRALCAHIAILMHAYASMRKPSLPLPILQSFYDV